MITIDPIKRPSKVLSSINTEEIMKEVDLRIADALDGSIEIPLEYVTKSELEAKGYLTSHQDISHLATQSLLSSIDTELSLLGSKVDDLQGNSGNIIIQGDSIANQIGAALVKNIKTIGRYEFLNQCVGGESCIDTLARNGYYPYMVAPFIIPASPVASEAVEIYPAQWIRNAISEDGESVTFYNSLYSGINNDKVNRYGNGINPWDKMDCVIGGVEGTLYFTRSSTNREYNYFVRKEQGESVVLTTPTLAVPIIHSKKSSPLVVFMGTNGGWNPVDLLENFNDCADVLVNYYETIARELGHTNYLFLGFYMTAFIDQSTAEGRINKWEYFESKMAEKFGRHYLSVRQYLRIQGWRDSGYKLGYRLVEDESGKMVYTCLEEDIAADKQAIADGKIPYCIVNGSNGVHMLSRPSAAVANQVIKRLYELGIIDEIRLIDVMSIKEAENEDINKPDYNDKKYIQFADAEVGRILSENFGDGVGLTEEEAASVTDIGTIFSENSQISSFDEFSLFTSVSSVKADGFKSCVSLRSITFPDSLTSVGENAFKNCSLLVNINGLEKLEVIGNYAFADSKVVCKELNLPKTKEIRYRPFSSWVIKNVANLGSITRVWDELFLRQTELKTCILPNTVTTIGRGAFNNCPNLETVNIPPTVTEINDFAFYSCTSLPYLFVEPTNPPKIGDDTFGATSFFIYVPDASVEVYKAADVWSTYADRIKGISEMPS